MAGIFWRVVFSVSRCEYGLRCMESLVFFAREATSSSSSGVASSWVLKGDLLHQLPKDCQERLWSAWKGLLKDPEKPADVEKKSKQTGKKGRSAKTKGSKTKRKHKDNTTSGSRRSNTRSKHSGRK